MGYTTEFEGSLTIDRPVDEGTYRLLRGISETRRMARDVADEYGVEGEFYVDGTGFRGQGRDANIIDFNRPPATQPGLWCGWLIGDDRQTIRWDGIEKFYNYAEWLEYLIDRILEPRGYVVDGELRWQGENPTDTGTITVRKNNVIAVDDMARWEQATDIRWDIMRAQERADALYAQLAADGEDALAGKGESHADWEEWQELLGRISGMEMAYDALAPDGIDDGIRDWYYERYPEDSSSCRIREDVTFADLDDGIDTGKSFVSVLGTDDSYFGPPVTRRCMTRLAELWGIAYDDLYHKWIDRV